MKIVPITQERTDSYEAFLKSAGGDLHQSSLWCAFQKSLPGRDAWIWGAMVESSSNKPHWLGSVAVVQHRLPLGFCWLSIVRGPILASSERHEEIWDALWKKIKELAQKTNAIFIRIEPPEKISLCFNGRGWHKAHAHHHPEWTLKVDLTPSEEQILGQMKPKGRYNIKVAQKNGVHIRKTHQNTDLEAFYTILKKTGTRDGFGIHAHSYYQNWLTSAHSEDWGTLLVAEHGGKIIAGVLMAWCGETAIYYYGASDHEHRPLMAPYLLQWEAMREAKNRDMKMYDFLGIAPPNSPNHPWHGITEFKEKFGGKKIQYPEAKEYGFKPILYLVLIWMKRLRKIAQ